MGQRIRLRHTRIVTTGRAAARGAPAWDTMIGPAEANTRRRGTRRITPADAARRICRAQVGTDCSTASALLARVAVVVLTPWPPLPLPFRGPHPLTPSPRC